MPITMEELKATGRLTRKDMARDGCWLITPELTVIVETPVDKLMPGDEYTINMVDEDGKYSGYFHIPKIGYWWDMRYFKLKT